MLELYNFSQSTCSLKVRILLEEKGLEWTDRRLVSKDHDHLSDWYLKLNPNGVVPTLIHDGRPVFESSAILQYLEESIRSRRSAPRTRTAGRRCAPGSPSSTSFRLPRSATHRSSSAGCG